LSVGPICFVDIVATACYRLWSPAAYPLQGDPDSAAILVVLLWW
jgi:hypothetical protein